MREVEEGFGGRPGRKVGTQSKRGPVPLAVHVSFNALGIALLFVLMAMGVDLAEV